MINTDHLVFAPTTEADAAGVTPFLSASVENFAYIRVAQITAGATRNLPNPINAQPGRLMIVENFGSASFTTQGTAIAAGTAFGFVWTGAAWQRLN